MKIKFINGKFHVILRDANKQVNEFTADTQSEVFAKASNITGLLYKI